MAYDGFSLQYHKQTFNSKSYLEEYYSHPQTYEAVLSILHKFFKERFQDHQSDLKILDYGSGPTLANSISVSKYASEIIFADFVQRNRDAIKAWVDKATDAYDWSEYFHLVVKNLEGGDEAAILERQERLRSISKGIVYCDITQDQFIESGYEGPYDVVMCHGTLQAVIQTKEDYIQYTKKLCTLLKPGGWLILSEFEDSPDSELGYYRVGEETFYYHLMTAAILNDCMDGAVEGAGLKHPQKERANYIKDSNSSDHGQVLLFARKPN